jgi:hypothetical protein
LKTPTNKYIRTLVYFSGKIISRCKLNAKKGNPSP